MGPIRRQSVELAAPGAVSAGPVPLEVGGAMSAAARSQIEQHNENSGMLCSCITHIPMTG